MVFAMFGIGWSEILVLGTCCFPVAAAAIIIPVVLRLTRTKPPVERWNEPAEPRRDAGAADANSEKKASDKFTSDDKRPSEKNAADEKDAPEEGAHDDVGPADEK